MISKPPGGRQENAPPDNKKRQQTMRTKLCPDIQKDIVAMVHDNALIRQIKIIRGIDKAIAVPANAQRKFLDNPLRAFQIGHTQCNRRIAAIAALNRSQTMQHSRTACCQHCRAAAKDRDERLPAEQHAERQKHHRTRHPVAARIRIKQAQRCQKSRDQKGQTPPLIRLRLIEKRRTVGNDEYQIACQDIRIHERREHAHLDIRELLRVNPNTLSRHAKNFLCQANHDDEQRNAQKRTDELQRTRQAAKALP